ncbi:50S ribosome-binding GTPase, partial [Candidatus Pacearchaeota archaeon]|nr:50S ribosome-binding GTPase [Candidatus Pacearchaeota archaeon]
MTKNLDTTKSTNSREATCRELLVPSVDISKIDTINVGIVGHIDHGKTTLLQKLSGKWADTHSEELKRGITIKLGYADAIIYDSEDKLTTNKDSKGKPIRYITFVDAPGHEMLMA